MRGPLNYVGGKNRLANHIISLIPKHITYVEPFAGGAQVLFRKAPSIVEVLNDIDGELVNFYRVCQSHHEELLRCLRYVLLSRKWYQLLASTSSDGLTDINRACKYFFLQRCSFGGRVARQHFAAHITKPPSFSPRRIPEIIRVTHERLSEVAIEHLPYEQVFKKYDRPNTFFYLDPPYFGARFYNHNFADEDFNQLKKSLAVLQGKFLLSINDHPEIRSLFSGYCIEEVSVAYSLQRHGRRRYAELLIRNY